MQLGEAKEELVAENLAPAQRLVDAAHQSTKDALVELREIIVGIHPGVLEAGLGVAIRALAARSAVPIGLELGEVDTPPIAPAISSITYYSIAELLTNITKHSGATRAILTITRHPDALGVDSLWIQVSDNGHGGAVVGGPDGLGTGLAGVAERIASVDGIFRLTSPRSGPTLIDIQLPTHT
jgi:signal transduction histidine kinase